jgi:hypothetical protein
MPKLNIAAELVPELETVGGLPVATAEAVPAAIVAAAPVEPVAPVGPVAPTAPCGIPKLNTAALEVPELATVALVPGAVVVVVPAAIVAAVPGIPC